MHRKNVVVKLVKFELSIFILNTLQSIFNRCLILTVYVTVKKYSSDGTYSYYIIIITIIIINIKLFPENNIALYSISAVYITYRDYIIIYFSRKIIFLPCRVHTRIMMAILNCNVFNYVVDNVYPGQFKSNYA